MDRITTFGHEVRELRRALDLTQDELARRVGCAAITIRKIEAGDLRPSQQIADRLALALSIPPKERAEFVRQARSVQPGDRAPEPTPTPQITPADIGQPDLSGRAIRSYTLGEKIGAGSFGAVYRGVQPLVQRDVAIKIILPQYANHPDFIRRFEAEAQLVARLEHPHIVPLYDYWREPGVAYLVMRLLRGGSLHNLIERGPLPVDQITRLLDQLCAALHAAHRAGVIHRDLKPSNVLLDEDCNAYLADFGIAKNFRYSDSATQPDALSGSTAYISPEQVLSEPVRPQTDVYALGVLVYELLTGAKPFTGPTPRLLIQQHLHTPLPPLAAQHEGLPAAFDDVIAHATAKDPLQRYPEVDGLLADFKQVAQTGRLIEVTAPAVSAHPIAIVNPYKGLRPFEEADAADFFGRETLTQQLLARLGEGGDLNRFLAIVGPSGSGKSSVVKAGLIPALRRGGLPNSEHWFVIDVLPGPHPLEGIEAALLRIAVNPPPSLLSQIKEDPRGLLRAIQRSLPDDDSELVLVLDQFEEVFTLVEAEAERAHLLDALVAAILAERSRVRVIVTLRADFLDQPLRYVDFAELIQRRSQLVLPLTPDEIERAIAGPADRVGVHLESGLPEVIGGDVLDQPGGLPLLQYALTELFEQRTDHTLTKAAYQAIGGVKGALGRRAEEVYQVLNENERALARQIFLRLVTLGEGVEDTRRRVARAELEALTEDDGRKTEVAAVVNRPPSSVTAVLDAFGKARLLSFDRDSQTRGPTLEVAHEALLREWPRLRDWLSESRADVRLQRLLANEVAEWLKAEREASFLLHGSRLQQFEEWVRTTSITLTNDERAYLEASLEERLASEADEFERQRRELVAAQKLAETERARAEDQTRAADRLRLRNRVIAAAGLVALLLAVLAGVLGAQANQNAIEAQVNRDAAQANAATAQSESVRADSQRDAAVSAQATAQIEAQVRATQQAIAQANFTRAEAQRLAGEANNLILSNGNVEQAALLSLRSLNLQYTPQGDIALAAASRLNFPRQLFLNDDAGWVNEVAFSPDGHYLLMGRSDWAAQLWDAQTGKYIRSFGASYESAWRSVAFSPDGRLLLTGSSLSSDVTLWDIQTGRIQRSFTAPDGIFDVAFSIDGKTILATSNFAQVCQWDIQTGELLRQFAQPGVWWIAVSPDGRYLATTGTTIPARLWDAQTGKLVRTFGQGLSSAGADFSPDGRYLLVSDASTAANLWEVETGREVYSLVGHIHGIFAVAFSPDGRYMLTGSYDRTARLWDVQTGKTVQVFNGHTEGINSVAFSPDGQSFMTGSVDFSARLWDIKPQTELPELIGHTAFVNDVKISPNGEYALTSSDDGTARLWDAHTGQLVRTFSGHEGYVGKVTFSPDSQYALTIGFDGTTRLWSVQTGKEVRRFSSPSSPTEPVSVAVSPDGKYVLVGYGEAVAAVWELDTGKLLDTLTHTGLINTGPINAVAISPDGQYAAIGTEDTFVVLWTFPKPHEIFRTRGHGLSGHVGPVQDIVFSPDGKSILSASADKTAARWDTQTGRELMRYIGHTSGVNSVDISFDGKLVATASSDGTARIWDTKTGEEMRRFDTHALVTSVRFSPDGKYLLMGDSTGVARMWDIDYHTTMQRLCSLLLRDFSDDERQQYGITDASPTCPTKLMP